MQVFPMFIGMGIGILALLAAAFYIHTHMHA
jgi:hypothetical protein